MLSGTPGVGVAARRKAKGSRGMLLIDCYNVLHQTMPPSLAGLDEGRLCGLLSRSGLARACGGAVVVCDGMVKPGQPSACGGEVELVYAGVGKSADGEILRRIEACSTPRKLVVVSTDRELSKAAGRRKARCWRSEEFVSKLGQAIRRLPGGGSGGAGGAVGPEKPEVAGLPEEEVRRWAKLFGVDPDAPLHGRKSGV